MKGEERRGEERRGEYGGLNHQHRFNSHDNKFENLVALGPAELFKVLGLT